MMEHRAACSVQHGDRHGLGSLLLTDDCLSFSGVFDLAIPLATIDLLRVHRGVLEVTWPGGTAAFGLGGRRAQDLADLIRGPRSLIDKLGVPQGARVLVSGVSDFGFRRQLQERAAVVLDPAAAARGPVVDLVFLGVQERHDLTALPALELLLARDGALWVVRPTSGEEVTEQDVRQAGRRAGLADIKAVGFSAAHTAHKFVVQPDRR